MKTVTLTGKILNTTALARVAIQYDAIDTVHFVMPPAYDGNDLTGLDWYLRYVLASGDGDHLPLTVTVGAESMTADLLLRGGIVSMAGRVDMQLVGVEAGGDPETDAVFQSEPGIMTVSRSIMPRNQAPTVVLWSYYLDLFSSSLASAQSAATSALESAASALSDKAAAQTAKTLAEAARDRAEAARTGAEAAQGLSEGARDASIAAKALSESARDAAAGSASNASGSATLAGEKATLASGHATTATDKAAAALASEQTATTKAAEALASAVTLSESLAQISTNKAGLADINRRLPHRVFGMRYRVSDGVCARTRDAVGQTFATHAGAYNPDLVNTFDLLAPWINIRQAKMSAAGVLLALDGDGMYDLISDAEMYTRYSKFYLSLEPVVVSEVAYVDWLISDSPLAGFKPAPMFINANGTENEYMYLGRGQCSEEGGALVTKPHLAHSRSRTLPTYLSMAAAKGDGGWGLYDYATMMSVFALMAVEAGAMNVKAAYGQGIQSGMPYSVSIVCTSAQTAANSIIIATAQAANFYVGMMAQIGTAYTSQNVAANRYITLIEDLGDGNTRITVDGAAFNTALGNTIACWDQPVPLTQIDALRGGSGYITQFNSIYRSHVCYRGVWDLWGNLWQFVAGFYRKDMAVYVCYNPSKYSVADPTTDAAWLYLGTPNLVNGYQKTWTFVDTAYGMAGYPSETGGGAGSSTFYAAYIYYFNSDYMGVRVLHSGGSWFYGDYVSPLCWHGYFTLSSANFSVGARLIRRVAA
jgi:hypothetical protein